MAAGAGVTLGYLRYVLGLDSLAFEEGLGQAEKKLKAAQKGMAKTAEGFTSLGQKMSIGITAPFALFAGKSFQAASDAAELQSAFNVTFGTMSGAMTEWARTTGDAMGRSTQEMMKAANTFGMFFNQAAPTKAAAAEMSKTFAVLAQDLSSFFNVDPGEALQKLQSGLSGETEPLRAFGVFLSDAALQAKALELGLKGANDPLTEQEKILARYAVIMDQTKTAQGDVARTASGTANQIRASQAAWEELSVTVGTKLLPALTPLVTKIGELLNWFSGLPGPVQTGVVAVVAFSAALGPVLVALGGIVKVGALLLPAFGKIAAGFTGTAAASGVAATGMTAFGIALRAALGPIGLVITAVTAGYYAWKNWDQISVIAQRAYQGVKTWLVDKLGAVVGWVREKVAAVTGFFRDMYVAVVGNSYVPDMVTEIGRHMARLDANLVRPARGATRMAGDAFKALADRVRPLLDALFPRQARENSFARELEDLETYAKAAGWSVEQLNEAMDRLRARQDEERFGPSPGLPASITGAGDEDIVRRGTEDIESHVERVNRSLPTMAENAKRSTARVIESFADMARGVVDSLNGIMGAIKKGDWLSALQGVLDAVGQIAAAFAGAPGAGSGGGMPEFGGFRAAGGPVAAGRSYVVGERGPEWFTPGRSGHITPNGGGQSRGGVVHFDLRGAVMTADLLRQMESMANGAAVSGARGGATLAGIGLARARRRAIP